MSRFIFSPLIEWIKKYDRLRLYYHEIQNEIQYKKWLSNGKSGATPHKAKCAIIQNYAERYNLRVFVETGTYFGDMVYDVKDTFDEIYSIELGERLFEKAAKRFSRYKHIAILQGDSGMILPKVLSRITQPCIFWIDAHFSAGITAKGERNTPVLQELHHIFNHPVRGHVILIDDAREFTGENDYPNVQDLKEICLKSSPTLIFEVANDIIKIFPLKPNR